jgi:acetoin utilization deacetylase AcuC-like enzyme
MFPIAFHPIYQHPLPEGHRFPMLKYELLPQQLLHEGTALESNFSRGICDLHPVLAIHKQEYVNDLIQPLNQSSTEDWFPLSKNLLNVN